MLSTDKKWSLLEETGLNSDALLYFNNVLGPPHKNDCNKDSFSEIFDIRTLL